MAKQTRPQSRRGAADQRIYILGYDQGYNAGYVDGLKEGNEVFQAWLVEELYCLGQDIRLELRSDTATPLDVLAEVIALVEAGQPVTVADDDEDAL